MLVLTWSIIGNAYAETDTESAVKIGFLYNFFKFIDWPQSVDTSGGYRLCTTGGNSLGTSLLALQDKTINNKHLSIKGGVSGKELKNCHMVFIGADEDISKPIGDLQGLAVVTVSDKTDFINQGGMLGLVKYNNRLAFEVNLDVANSVDIRFSAKILELAKRIHASK
ncbi:MAG: YfiR family protein [Methylococcales bacterium]|nr:YfiR family protein [Methylococcales bacterium]